MHSFNIPIQQAMGTFQHRAHTLTALPATKMTAQPTPTSDESQDIALPDYTGCETGGLNPFGSVYLSPQGCGQPLRRRGRRNLVAMPWKQLSGTPVQQPEPPTAARLGALCPEQAFNIKLFLSRLERLHLPAEQTKAVAVLDLIGPRTTGS
jgi:hypothetical protein